MLSQTDNEMVTNTNRGTPMGELFRRFWLPVALSEELPGPDCVPVRVKVLNEDLIAFRGSDGRVGLVDAYCPHRGAPMFFGRNEEDGLRCVYHGWKFNVDGVCTDLPNAPEGETFKAKVPIRSYPCVDAGNLLWAYMGPKDKQPPFPAFEWTTLPKSHRYITKFRLECNYLQAMEGDYDPSHASFLHSTLGDATIPNPLAPEGVLTVRNMNMFNPDPQAPDAYPRAVGAKRRVYQGMPGRLEDVEVGGLSITSTQLPDGRASAAAAGFWMMPIFCTAGIGGPDTYNSNMRVPVDNESLMFYRLRWSPNPIPAEHIEAYKHSEYFYPKVIPGSWQTEDNVTNDYNIDRVAQKTFSYSGIKTFPLQDIAMMEHQWGPIADRTQEHLTSMDHMIIYVRRRLLRAAKELANGIEPEAPWHPEQYRMHRVIVERADGDLEAAEHQARAEALGSAMEVTELALPVTA